MPQLCGVPVISITITSMGVLPVLVVVWLPAVWTGITWSGSASLSTLFPSGKPMRRLPAVRATPMCAGCERIAVVTPGGSVARSHGARLRRMALVMTVAASLSAAGAAAQTIRTTNGPVGGVATDGVVSWKGVVFGESAGGGSVSTLLVSPLARGLFHKAIVQPGGGRAGGLMKPRVLPEAEQAGLVNVGHGCAGDVDQESSRLTTVPSVAGCGLAAGRAYSPGRW